MTAALCRAAAVLMILGALTGCRATLYAIEWGPSGPPFDAADIRDANGHLPGDDPSECDHAEHNHAGGYAPACGDLPGLLGDDC